MVDTSKVRQWYKEYWDLDDEGDCGDNDFMEIDVELANQLADAAMKLADEVDELREQLGIKK